MHALNVRHGLHQGRAQAVKVKLEDVSRKEAVNDEVPSAFCLHTFLCGCTTLQEVSQLWIVVLQWLDSIARQATSVSVLSAHISVWLHYLTGSKSSLDCSAPVARYILSLRRQRRHPCLQSVGCNLFLCLYQVELIRNWLCRCYNFSLRCFPNWRYR